MMNYDICLDLPYRLIFIYYCLDGFLFYFGFTPFEMLCIVGFIGFIGFIGYDYWVMIIRFIRL